MNIKSAGDTAFKDCNGLRAKIAADMDALKAKVTQRKHDRGVKHAEIHSEMLDNEASIAIEYAVASRRPRNVNVCRMIRTLTFLAMGVLCASCRTDSSSAPMPRESPISISEFNDREDCLNREVARLLGPQGTAPTFATKP